MLSSVAALAACPDAAHAHVDWARQSGIVRLDSATAVARGASPRTWRTAGLLDVPDRFGPGAVLTAGNVWAKVVNDGTLGNPFTTTSADPGGQWPGASGIEYLNAITLAVGGVNPLASDPASTRRVSFFEEWRPPTLDPVDRIYRSFEGAMNGQRFVNDDGDSTLNAWGESVPAIDEEFLDGHDDDGDGRIDEDYAALGQQEFSYVIRDDTPQAVNTVFNEKHVPLGLQARVRAWAYSAPTFQDFDVCEYAITNVSGHPIDSLTIGWLVDMDAGPIARGGYWDDDVDLPQYPSGAFVYRLGSAVGDLPDPAAKQGGEAGQQHIGPPILATKYFPADSALCPRLTMNVHGFSVADDDGDQGLTPGIGSFLLIDHTTDPTGSSGPSRVGFKSFRSALRFATFPQGGLPITDQERFESMVSGEGVRGGSILASGGGPPGDYAAWCSVGPWRHVQPGQTVTATIAFAVSPGTAALARRYTNDYQAYQLGRLSGVDLMVKYPSLATALAAQVAFQGIHEYRQGFLETRPIAQGGRDFHGRETPLRMPRGAPSQLVVEDCGAIKGRREITVTDQEWSWFDFDCNYCTGVWAYREVGYPVSTGLFHHSWYTTAPPPNPNTNVSASYDYTDNPDRAVVAAGDRTVRLAWDNLPEVSADPITGWFDYRGVDVWKAADWTRPVGAAGPAESDWLLVGEYRVFDYFKGINNGDPPLEHNYTRDPATGDKVCPQQFVPGYYDPATGLHGKTLPICLDRWDLWDHQSGRVLRPDWTIPCETDSTAPAAPIEIDSGDLEWNVAGHPGGSVTHAFARAGTYAYHCMRHPAEAGTVVVAAGGVDSTVVQILDGSVAPTSVTVRPGGRVRWVNLGSMNHALQTTRPCVATVGVIVHRIAKTNTLNLETRVHYPVGRYVLVDPEVRNGFAYFYSVTAFDSTTSNSLTSQLSGRREAFEADAVTPQSAADAHGRRGAWVVPNPYRGYATIGDRPSSWDLTPTASDPTGTHIDFMGLPSGGWTIRIYTVAGDLVQTLHATDAVNASVRHPQRDGGAVRAGYNRQQDSADDGEARWNLVSRNGQDVVSGIYLFTVDSAEGTQRGKFVIIR